MSEELDFTDSTITSKDSEKKMESSEFENQFIHRTYSKKEKNEFNEPNHELKWKDFSQNTYHFKQDIERVWLICRSFDFLSLISNQGHYPCIFIKGEDTWKVGNQFKGNIFGLYPFVAKVNKSISLPEMKKIEWIFNILNNEYFIIKLEFLKVTEDNTTVALKTFKFEKTELGHEIEETFFKMNTKIRLFNRIEELLEKEPINLIKYESGIITGKMEDIWNLVLDFNKFTTIAPNNNFLPNINIKDLKVGEKREVSVFLYNQVRTLDVTLKCKEERPGWNKWIIICEASGGHPKKIPRHTILFQLTKINNNECQLSLLTKFHEPIDNDEFKEITNKKKYLILSIKDFFENFYSPSSQNLI